MANSPHTKRLEEPDMIPEVIGAIVTRSSSDFWGCGFPGGSDGKESAMREPRVLSLSREDLLEEEMATHSSILAGEIHGQRPGIISKHGGFCAPDGDSARI